MIVHEASGFKKKAKEMKLITRDTDYAVRALCHIAGHRLKMVSASELVKELKMPRPFLRKILQCLTNADILVSYKGKNGGFSLNRKPEQIHLVDLITIFQGQLTLNECFFKKKLCPNRPSCPLKNKIAAIEDFVVKELSTISIAELSKS